jgi:hypothetical protein
VALTATLMPPGASRSQRRTVTTARTEAQSQVTSSAPLAPAISAAWASPHSSSTKATPPSRASGGVSAANAAMSAAVCAAALATANAPTSILTIPAVRITPTRANPRRVAPPCSPRVTWGRSAMAAPPAILGVDSARSPRGASRGWPPVAGPRSPRAAGGLTGRRGAGQGRALGRRPRWPGRRLDVRRRAGRRVAPPRPGPGGDRRPRP